MKYQMKYQTLSVFPSTLVVKSSGSPEAMPVAQALNTAVVSHVTRADEQKTSVSRDWSTSLSKHYSHKNKGGVEHHWCDPAASEAWVHELVFICFCWSFPTAALERNFIMLETETFWRTAQGKCVSAEFSKHHPNLRVTTFHDISVSWTLINSFTNHDLLCIKTLLQKEQLRTPESWDFHYTAGGTTAETHARGKGNSRRKRHLPHIKWKWDVALPPISAWPMVPGKRQTQIIRSPDLLRLQIPKNSSQLPAQKSRFLPNGVGLEPSHFPLVPKWEPSTFRIVFPLSFFLNQSDRVSIQAHQAFKYPHQRMRINLIFSRTRQYFELL